MYTTHDWRFLAKLAQTSHQVWFLQLEKNETELETRSVPHGIQYIPWEGGEDTGLSLMKQLRLLPGLLRVLKQVKPDIIHAGPIQSCGFLAALSRYRPLMLMSWGSDLLVDADRHFFLNCLTSFTLRRADTIIGDCNAVREKIHQLVDFPDDSIITFPWGINLDLFRKIPPSLDLRHRLGWENKKIILSTRSWETIYGIDVLIRAFRETVVQYPDVRLILMGNGSLAGEICSFINENDLVDFVYFTGQVAQEQIVHFFNSADLYISTSYSDGSSVSLLEAMACSLPVVVSDIPGNREWIQPAEQGWLFEAGNPDSLKEALVMAFAHSAEWVNMGSKNRAIAEQKANWDQNFQKLMDAYCKISEMQESKKKIG
jgi:L-malate glycosyltransferase